MSGTKTVAVKLTEGNILKKMLIFAVPIIIGNLLQELYYIFDTLIVGQTLGDIKLAAVGATSSLVFLATGFIIGITSGCAVLTSQFFGAGDDNRMKKSVASHIVIALISTVVLTVGFVLLAKPLLILLNTTSDTFAYSKTYLTIIYGGLPATMLYNVTSALLRSVGDSKTPLMLLLLSSVLNIGLDLLFILVFGWDVAGAAIATVISQGISALLCVVYIKFKVPFIIPNKESFKGIKSMLGDEFKIGFPMGFQYSVISIGMMVLQFFVNGFGSSAVAAYTIGNRVQLFLQNPLSSMSIVMATFAGQNAGAKRYDRIKSGTKKGLLLCLAYSVVIGVLAFIFAEFLTSIFLSNYDPITMKYSIEFIRWNCIFEWSLGMLFIYRGVIQGLKDGVVPMIGSVLEVMMRVLSPLIFSTTLGFASVSFAGPAAWSASAILMIIVYFHKFRKLKRTGTL